MKKDINVRTTFRDHTNARRCLESMPDIYALPIEEIVERITALNDGIRRFWGQAQGWAPIEAANLLNRSRLDWQVSLSSTLKIWTSKSSKDIDDGHLILAWANLGCLVEGTMKLFLSAYYATYKADVVSIEKKLKPNSPDGLQLEPLRIYFRDNIWDETFDKWVQKIQSRRNAIHAFKNRDIGTFGEFLLSVREYLMMLRYINYRLPYPDEESAPIEQ